MGQVAFDTLKFVKTLEHAGLSANQACAISVTVKDSHKSTDVATQRNLNDVHKNLSAEIADVHKDLSAKIADFRKDTDIERYQKALSSNLTACWYLPLAFLLLSLKYRSELFKSEPAPLNFKLINIAKRLKMLMGMLPD